MSTNYSYGNKGITSCKFCNEELTWEHPGKIAKRVRRRCYSIFGPKFMAVFYYLWRIFHKDNINDNIYKETICNKCLLEDEYYANDCELNDYPNEYDII